MLFVSHATGETDAEWLVTQGPLLDQVMNDSHFPVASRVGQSASEVYQAASSPECIFAFGLERILEGVTALSADKGQRGTGNMTG
ncbi:MAG: hypothetical protein IPK19_26770 [Chloroflexi bacterium]|nr:hypothetical protein [Chloroflexota bacterium]